MVHRTRYGLGPPESARKHFEALQPHALKLGELRQLCPPDGPDYLALDVALNGLEDAAFHFTRRRYFFELALPAYDRRRPDYAGLGDPLARQAHFATLTPYRAQLRALQGQCKPFGHEYQALSIPIRCLDTAAFHFTRDESFYGAEMCRPAKRVEG